MTVLETERLRVRRATVDDARLVHELWTSPEVMRNVGYPRGLDATVGDVRRQIEREHGDPFDRLLIVETKGGEPIGQCFLGGPDPSGTATTDIKLRPTHWGRGYGVEVKQGLVDFLFTHTSCRTVEATPNVGNVASIRMQEAVGAVRVGEGVFEFPESERDRTTPVRHYVYRLGRATWERRRQSTR